MSTFPDNDTSGLDRSSGPQKKQSNPPANPTRTLPTTNPNAVSKQSLPLTIPDRIRLYEKPHRKLREFVMEGLVQVRDELLPLLYYSYVRLYMKIIVEKLPRDSVRKWKNDFLHVESYMKEINYLENMGTVSEERIREDPMLHQMLAAAKTISLSQFTFESLFLFIQKNNLQEIDFDVLQSMKINLKIVTDSPSEADKKLPKPLFMAPAKDILKMSEGSGRIGVRLDEALFMHLLQSLSEVKKSGETDLSSQNLFKYIPSFKGDIQDGKTIPLPEQSLDYQLDFAHAFLDRPILSQQTEPNVLHITVRDPEENVTCIEIDPQGQVMLVGFNNAKILMVILNPKFKEKTTEYEEYKQSSTEDLITALNMDPITFDAGDFYEQEDSAMEEEQEEQNGVVGDDENGIDGDKMFKQRAKKEKYEIVEFLGHEDAITSLNLHFDGLYFLSCSVDTTIRLWCVRQRICLNIFKGHINTVWTAKFACRGLFFVSGSSDTTARVWVTGHLVPIRSFLGHTSDVNLVEYSQDCNNIVTASYDKSIRIWDVDSTRCLKILYPGAEVISSIGLNYYSNMLVSGLNDGTFVLWDIHNDIKVGTFTLANNDKARVNSVGFSYDGTFIVASSRKKIGYFEVSRLREQNKNQNKEHEQFGHVSMNGKLAEKQEEGSVALNCVILEEGSLNYSFLVTRFSPGNFIYAVSRCAE